MHLFTENNNQRIMATWQNLLKNSITSATELAEHLTVNTDEIDEVCQTYPMRINPYYLQLILKHGSALARQAIPERRELEDRQGMEDPLGEENLSTAPNLVHKYPDRALFLVSDQCSMLCRFCTRKRKVGRPEMVINDHTLQAGLDYLRATPRIREVLISGGDPLLLSDTRLEKILRAVRAIPSVEVIRIGTRVPCTLPMRVTPELAAMLGKYHPLYINTHFNHPSEITAEATLACARLANAGIPLGCQTVLLRGVNDQAKIIKELMLGLLRIRVKPYYLFQGDLTRGTNHFRTPIESGLAIMRELIGHVSGMAVPSLVLDAPGGGGKIPLTPEYIISHGRNLEFLNYRGIRHSYPDPGCSCEVSVY